MVMARLRGRGLPVSRLNQLIYASLILWKERSDEGIVESAEIDGKLRRRFVPLLQSLFPREAAVLSDTEVESALAGVLATSNDYRDWWDGLLKASGLVVDFADREPMIAVDQAALWEGLQDRLDADALITLALARARGGRHADVVADCAALDAWDCVARVGDRNLQALWRRGLSDLHVHTGGARFGHLVWFDLMDGLAEPNQFQSLVGDQGQTLEPAFLKARAARQYLAAKLREARPVEAEQPLADSGARWRWDRRRLTGERTLLVWLWAQERGCLDQEMTRRLDGYLLAKSLFARASRQPSETRPGLAHFDDQHFRSLKPSSTLTGGYGTSGRLQLLPSGDALAFLLESPDLRRIELRIAPLPSAAGYGEFARHFDRLARDIAKDRRPHGPPVDIRFAVHYKRSRRKTPLLKMLIDTDRESAALRLALTAYAQEPAMRRRLARIDVAGQERDTQVAVFAPYMRLTRGDEDAVKALSGMDPDRDPRAPEFAKWLELAEHGDHRPSLSTPRLGMTVHAGEDFADPLDGLHQVASAIELYNLRAGDGIGHGLAMTTDTRAFSETRRPWAQIARGAALDSLIWLFDLINHQDRKRLFAADLHDLRDQIQQEGRDIYDLRGVLAEDLVWLRTARITPETPRRDEVGPIRWRLFLKDAGAVARARRDQLGPASESRGKLDRAVAWAQKRVLKDVIQKRIVVEMNPSSNLRISGAGSLGMSPTVKMLLQIENGLLASINTDNPGAFMSRVENEYAILLAGCRELGIAEGRARDLLERARWIGLNETWWPDRPPPGDGDDDDGDELDGAFGGTTS